MVDKMPSDDGSDVIPKLLAQPFKMCTAEFRHHVIQRGRPAPLLSVTSSNTSKSDFQSSWYETHRWLCGSFQLNKLFCWPCLLMRPESSSWCSIGVDELRRFSSVASKHASSKSHLKAITEYDGTLIEAGLLPEFINDKNNSNCKSERVSDSDSDYLGNYLGPKRQSASQAKDGPPEKASESATLTFRTWQQTTRALLESRDPRLARRKRRLAKIKIKNAQLEGEKIRLEIQLLEAKLELQKSLQGSAFSESPRVEPAHFSSQSLLKEGESDSVTSHQLKVPVSDSAH